MLLTQKKYYSGQIISLLNENKGVQGHGYFFLELGSTIKVKAYFDLLKDFTQTKPKKGHKQKKVSIISLFLIFYDFLRNHPQKQKKRSVSSFEKSKKKKKSK